MATWNIRIEGRSYEVDVQSLEAGFATVVVDGASYDVSWEEPEGATPVVTPVAGPAAAPAAASPPSRPATAGAGVVTSPLPGLVLELLVKQGDAVKQGDVVAKIEAMKMANEIRSDVAGTVAEVLVRTGDTVDEGAHLLRIG
jgi:glutaconyl-CoA/methylmalonyl-CoA decarboxylase subunit gamma